MKTRVLALLVLAAVLATGMGWAQDRAAADPDAVPAIVRPAIDGPVTEAVGTITYDNNTPFQRSGQVDGTVGNRFTAAAANTLSTLTLRLAGNYGGTAVASVWAPAGGGGTAMLLGRATFSGIPSGAGVTAVTVVVPLAPAIVNGGAGTFIAGIRNTFYTGLQCVPPSTGLNTTCDGVALTQGTATIGNGTHAAAAMFAAPGFPITILTASGTADISGQNAIIRATGENLPVELMQFGID